MYIIILLDYIYTIYLELLTWCHVLFRPFKLLLIPFLLCKVANFSLNLHRTANPTLSDPDVRLLTTIRAIINILCNFCAHMLDTMGVLEIWLCFKHFPIWYRIFYFSLLFWVVFSHQAEPLRHNNTHLIGKSAYSCFNTMKCWNT